MQADTALRVDCDAAVAPPAALAFTFGAADGGPPRTVRDDTVGASHRLTAWRMTPDTTDDYVVSVVDGTATSGRSWTTGPLPDRAAVELATTGSAGRTEDVRLIAACAGALDPAAVDFAPDGRVGWYQALETGLDEGSHTVEGIAARMGVLVNSERDPTAVNASTRRPCAHGPPKDSMRPCDTWSSI
jgi:hypothetical protein